MKSGKDLSTPPVVTVGFNVEQVSFKKVKFTVWVSRTKYMRITNISIKDVGGQDSVRRV